MTPTPSKSTASSVSPSSAQSPDRDSSAKDKALSAALAEIEKSYGKGAIMRLGDSAPIQELRCI